MSRVSTVKFLACLTLIAGSLPISAQKRSIPPLNSNQLATLEARRVQREMDGRQIRLLASSARQWIRQRKWSLAKMKVDEIQILGEEYSKDAALLAGEIAFREGHFDEALRYFGHILYRVKGNVHPVNDLATHWFVLSLCRAGQSAKAVEILRGAYQSGGNGFDIANLPTADGFSAATIMATDWLYLSREMANRGDFSEALEASSTAFKLAPSNQLVAMKQADGLLRAGKRAEAKMPLSIVAGGPDRGLAALAKQLLADY